MFDSTLSQEKYHEPSKITDRIRSYIEDSVAHLEEKERKQVFFLLTNKMGIRTEAHIAIYKVLHSLKEKLKWKN